MFLFTKHKSAHVSLHPSPLVGATHQTWFDLTPYYIRRSICTCVVSPLFTSSSSPPQVHSFQAASEQTHPGSPEQCLQRLADAGLSSAAFVIHMQVMQLQEPQRQAREGLDVYYFKEKKIFKCIFSWIFAFYSPELSGNI